MEQTLTKKKYEEAKRNFKSFDDFLDSNLLHEPYWLKQADLAKFELSNIQHYAQRYFKFYACFVISNHVHLLKN